MDRAQLLRRGPIAAAALMIVGGLAPWVTVGGETLANGTEKDGVILIVLAVVAIVLSFVPAAQGRWPGIALAVVGALGTLICVIDLGSVSGDDSIGAVLADPGWGLWLDLVASILLLAVALAALVVRRRDARSPAAPAA